MMNLVYLAQVVLVFVILGAVAVYVLDTIYGLNLSENAQGFIMTGFDIYDLLGNFAKVVVLVGIVGLIIAMFGIRVGGNQ